MRFFPDELRRARKELSEREFYIPLTLANAQYINISNERVGNCVGQYAPTRKRPIPKKVTKKK